MAAQHVIELNGKRYDTTTGKVIDDAPKAPAATHPTKPVKESPAKLRTHHTNTAAKPTKRPANIDGFTRSSGTTTQPHTSSATSHPKRTVAKPNHTKRHTDKSHTLMRAPAKAQTIRSISADTTPATGFVAATSVPRITVDPQRLKRAQAIPQNKFIGRFTAESTPPPIVIEPTPTIATPTPTAPQSALAELAPAKPANQFEQAIAHATSHTEPKTPKQRAHHRVARKLHLKPHTVSIASVVLIAGVVIGTLTYSNLPNIHMKVASSRSGITGTMPNYTPAGYSLNKNIGYKTGEIVLSYTSNIDQRKFTVTQTQSYWTSDVLRETYVEPLGVDYQTIQENGKTIYLYGNNATWVDGGIWYRIESKDANLSSSQITNLAKSL